MESDPLGLYKTDDQTLKHPIASLNIKALCKTTPVACTVGLIAAISFECTGCQGYWHATNVILHILGQIYAYNGNPQTLGVKMVDKSVNSFAAAVKHEHAWHIDIAAAAVSSIISQFEGKQFSSEMECQDAGSWTNGEVQSKFKSVSQQTQKLENQGGDPTKVPFQ
jgi:hypothetical protein